MSDLARTPTLTIKINAEIQDLIPGFLDHRQHDIQILNCAMGTGDFDLIRTLGHRMRGAGGGYGFQMISTIGQAIEGAAHSKNMPEIATQIEMLTDYLDRIEVVYE
jgi:HPt (histidine-containing phosphotransfer) domain-containing protein